MLADGEQHAGYACHGHANPWSVRQHGSFCRKTPAEFFKMFLNWQDHVHRKIHINMCSGIAKTSDEVLVNLCRQMRSRWPPETLKI